VLPTLLTLGNLVAGVLAIAYVADAWAMPPGEPGRLALWAKAAWALVIGMACDALDGRVARMTGAASAFGAELDSLADMVSFGVAPALLAKAVAQDAFPWLPPRVALVLVLVYAVGAALRLARYNVESHRVAEPGAGATRTFRGLPSPGAAGVVVSLLLVKAEYGIAWASWSLLAAPPLLGVLMISRIAYPHVMNRWLSRARSPFVVVLMLVVVLVAIDHPEACLAAVFGAYALAGPAAALVRLVLGRGRGDEEDDDEDVVPVDGDPVDRP
jgi:CDP-diacylglycerol--serine O-phosphatidyltransferase